MASTSCPKNSHPCNTSNVGFGVGECCDKDGNVVKDATACDSMLDYGLIQRAHDAHRFEPCRALVAMCNTHHHGDPRRTKLCTEASSNPHCHHKESKDASTCEYKPLRTPHEYPLLNWAQHQMREHFANSAHHSDTRPKPYDPAHNGPTS